MGNSDWVKTGDYPDIVYTKNFQGEIDVRVFRNFYYGDTSEPDLPPNNRWAMSAAMVGIAYQQLNTDDFEEAKVEALETTRQQAFKLLAALMTEDT